MGSKVLGLELSSRIKSDESERRKASGLLQTLLHEDGVNPCKETIERCFIWSVPPECLNEGVIFKEGSVVDAYFNNGWWTGVVVVERPDGSFFVYFDDPPDIMRFIRSQLIPHADWIGSEWVKSKNKVLSQHMFRTGKSSPPRDLCAEYSLNDFVEVVVTHGWRKGRVTEILIENNYKVYFDATKEDAVFNYTEIRLSMEWLGGGSWIRAHKREFGNNAATPIRSAQESPSDTLVLESNEDDTGVELPLPHGSDDMMDDVATPIIDPQEIPRGETMSKSDDKIALPKIISEPGTNGGVLDRINKRSNLKLVGTVENVLGREFKKLEDLFLAPVIKMGRRQKHMVFSRHLIYHLLLRRIDIGKKGLWFSFGEQLMRFSLREFHLATGLPCVVDKDEEEVETSATKNKKKDPWMKKNQTLNTLLNLLVKKSTELTGDQRLRLGATILVEGILMASNPVTSIPEERLLRARNFKEFCNLYMIVLELKVLSQHMFRTGKLVEMTREISESEKEKIWVRALVITEIQGGDRRKVLIKRCTSSQNLSDEAEEKHSIVDICKIRPSPPRDLCAEYSLNDFVEVIVTHGWRKGRVTEILIENNYKVYFDATKEDAVFSYTEIRLSMEWLGGGSWIRAHKREFENNAATPIRSAQESLSNTLVLESNEDDTVNDDATEITSSRESHSNTSVLEATETETQNHETVDGVELPLPYESDDMMDDVATPIIDPQEIPRGLELLKLRKINNPDLFLNKTALVVGVKFLEEIYELYVDFLGDKEGFQFRTGFDKYNIEKNINFLYSAIAVEEKYWVGVVVNLEKRSITTFNCAAMKFTYASLVPYINAYAMALPFMIRNFFKDVSMDTSKFSIKIVSEGFPQVLKIEDSGVYALKLIECHAMRIVDLTKLSEEKIASIREKLAREFGNNAATPTRSAQESPSNTIVLESNEDDTVNDDATEITSSRERATGVVLPLPHESDDMMDDVATP
ncbi:hypothetical protein DY000_02021677 [Brassica cretica]|uniref:Agenet domain-containing protein n=2 Tax=Brassica cretica TaxID=69181 RepID=A0ABQ7EII1_BRACR|nr:hypothetical protein DY000_02021677 [Brassica cretica]